MDEYAIFGLLAGLGVVIALIAFACYVLYVIGLWKVFTKAGTDGWKAIIPYLNTYELYKMSWEVKFFWIFLGVSVVSFIAGASDNGFVTFIGSLCSIALFVLNILSSNYLAKSFGQVTAITQHAAVGLELLHTASLVHDDVVDGSDLRRGLPSVNARWNNKIAVLTGDYMLSKVIEILAALRNVKILSIVSEMGKSLSEGELLQLHTQDDMWISERDYFSIIDKKTARLFAACCETGAASSGASMKQETALSCFGEELGICFQMQDDILDYSDSEELGKPTMGDIRDGKVTLPLLIALNRAPKDEAKHIISLTQHEMSFSVENEIKSFVLRYDGIRYSQQRMREHQQAALSALSSFRPCPATEALTLLLNHTVNRVF